MINEPAPTFVFENGFLEFSKHTAHNKVQTLGMFCQVCNERLTIDQIVSAMVNGGHCKEEK